MKRNIECPDCKTVIREDATVCPQCRSKVQKKYKSAFSHKTGSTLLFIVLASSYLLTCGIAELSNNIVETDFGKDNVPVFITISILLTTVFFFIIEYKAKKKFDEKNKKVYV